MCLNLNYCQFKRSRFSCTSTYMNPVVTTNQKPTVVTQKWRGKEHKHTTKENHQTKEEEAKRRNEQRKTTKTTRKQVIIISTNLSIITLNINGLNGPIKRHGVGDWIRKTRQESRDKVFCLANWNFGSHTPVPKLLSLIFLPQPVALIKLTKLYLKSLYFIAPFLKPGRGS